MILLVEEICRMKKYKDETLYLAISIADRYLVNLAVQKEKSPCLVTLSVTALLIAAKVEQPMAPSYPAMVQLVEETQKFTISREVLVALEESILKMLQF